MYHHINTTVTGLKILYYTGTGCNTKELTNTITFVINYNLSLRLNNL